MVRKFPVIVICNPEDGVFYRDFPLPGEELLIVPYGQAICSLLAREIDLVLLDCDFDVRFGLQLLTDLKTRFPQAPVLFITAQSSEDVIISAFKRGARDFFRKPLAVFRVRQVVLELLQAKRNMREDREVTRSALPEDGAWNEGHLCEVGVLQPAVMKVVCHIETHFRKALSLDTMAAIAGMSKYHFARQFRQEVGMSPVRYLKFIRIQRAKEMLKRTDLSIFSAALKVGFQDVSNFNKNFKNVEGCTPSQYRQRSGRIRPS